MGKVLEERVILTYDLIDCESAFNGELSEAEGWREIEGKWHCPCHYNLVRVRDNIVRINAKL